MASPEKTVDHASQMTGAGCLIRVSWMLVGNIILAACAAKIFMDKAGMFSASDVVFWADVALMIWLRRIDVTRMKGLTAGGEPATLGHWKRYAIALAAISVVLWLAAHAGAMLRR